MKTSSPTKAAPAKKAAASAKKSSAAKPLNTTTAATSSASSNGVDATQTPSQKPAQKATQNSVLADQIAARAYQIWQQEGCPEGTHEHNWRQAEQELTRNPNAFTP